MSRAEGRSRARLTRSKGVPLPRRPNLRSWPEEVREISPTSTLVRRRRSSGSLRDVSVAEFRVVERKLHELGHRDRPTPADPRDDQRE